MEVKTSKYQRERSKFHPKSLPTVPCVFCSKTPTARAHLFPVLEGRRGGIPMKFLNEDWNLVNLCRGCHLLFDDRLEWWAKHERKVRYGGIDSEKLINLFRRKLKALGVVTYDFDLPEEFDAEPFFGAADDFSLAQFCAEECHTYIVTKWGYFGIKGKKVESVKGVESEHELETQIEDAWSRSWRDLRIPSSKEYEELLTKCFAEAIEKRKALVTALWDKIEVVKQKTTELLNRVHPVSISLGSLLNSLEVTGFDVTTLRQGYITVLTFEQHSEEYKGGESNGRSKRETN